MSFYTRYELLCQERALKPTTAAERIGIAKSTTTRWRNGSIPDMKTLETIADFFEVSTDYLLDKTEIRNPPSKQSPKEIAQVALFSGDVDVTDEMWKEVEDFASYIVAKHKRNSNK